MARIRIKGLVLLASTAALALLMSASGGQAQYNGGNGLGSVERCSLAGVNPADHPSIFGNPSVARSYGFVQSSNGSWHVGRGCRARGAAAYRR